MMRAKSKTPQIRFKGFSEEWEEKKLESLGDFQGGGTPNTSIEHYWTGHIPWISSSDITEGDVKNINLSKFINEISIQKSATKLIPKGSVLFVARVGVGKLAIACEDMCTSQDFANLILKYDDSYFIGFYFLSKNTLLDKYSQGTSIKGFTVGDLKTLTISTPFKAEQTKIGDYFQNLDKLIEQKEQKYRKLRQFKTAMLSKMFPQNGAATPEIYFKGFSGEWREKELHQIVNLCSGRDYKHLSNGNIPVYGTGGYMLSVNQALSYDEDAIGIGRKGTIDKPYILKAPFWTVDTLFYAVPKEKNNLAFTYSLFQKINWKQKDESTGVPSLSKVTINSIQVFTPEFDEQTKIGNYFQKLDTLIDLHAQELDKLRHIKKASLEKMFV